MNTGDWIVIIGIVAPIACLLWLAVIAGVCSLYAAWRDNRSSDTNHVVYTVAVRAKQSEA